MNAPAPGRGLLLAAMAALAALAWLHVWNGAGMGMRALDMTVLTLFPHLHPDAPGTAPGAGLLAAMWFVMMLAMMTPAALPLVLLGGRVMRHHGQAKAWSQAAPLVVAGYLACWGVFAVAAAALQKALQPSGIVSPMFMWSRSAWFSAAVLAAAGAWQLSPWKDACLVQCRSPAAFLQRHWRPGRAGAFALGLRHGAWCVGCCWLLMALLFVFGIMNLAWIAALAVLVLAEKLTRGPRLARASGIVLLAWAAATLAVSAQPRGAGMAAMPGSMERTPDAMHAFTAAKVLSVDVAQRTIELQHGEIPNLGMPAMAMEFAVKDPKMIEGLKPGDAVRFRASVEGGRYWVTELVR